MSLRGRTAVITGAAGGIGWTIGERLRAKGMSVAFLDMDPAVVDVATGLSNPERPAIDIPADVTGIASVRAAFDSWLLPASAAGPEWRTVDTNDDWPPSRTPRGRSKRRDR